VQNLSGALAESKVNVEELETSCESAAMTGETLFRARAQLRLPPGCDVEALRSQLERIAADLMVDLRFDV
jgi:glycine cleavage system regulatory protein